MDIFDMIYDTPTDDFAFENAYAGDVFDDLFDDYATEGLKDVATKALTGIKTFFAKIGELFKKLRTNIKVGWAEFKAKRAKKKELAARIKTAKAGIDKGPIRKLASKIITTSDKDIDELYKLTLYIRTANVAHIKLMRTALTDITAAKETGARSGSQNRKFNAAADKAQAHVKSMSATLDSVMSKAKEKLTPDQKAQLDIAISEFINVSKIQSLVTTLDEICSTGEEAAQTLSSRINNDRIGMAEGSPNIAFLQSLTADWKVMSNAVNSIVSGIKLYMSRITAISISGLSYGPEDSETGSRDYDYDDSEQY